MSPTSTTPDKTAAHTRMRSRRSIGAVAGLGLLTLTGTVMAVGSPVHVGTLTSAIAAQAVAAQPAAMPSFADLVEQLKPTVVSVYVDAEVGTVALPYGQQGGERSPFGQQSPFGQGSPFEFFFHQFGRQRGE